MKRGPVLLALALSSGAGCGRGDTTAVPKGSVVTPTPSAARAAGATVPVSALEQIPADCAAPRIIVATVAATSDNHYAWTATRQAMLANPRFKVVSHAPEAAGELYFRQIEDRVGPAGGADVEPTRSLVAYCKDADTCNGFAAMHRAVVRSSHPQPICGNVPGDSDNYQTVDIQWNGAQGDLPKHTDTAAQCARLGACLITADPGTPGDPIRECQDTPAAWKTHCALQRSCADVLACLK